MSAEDESVEVLDEQEALHLVASAGMGRLAFAVAGIPDIVPINHCVDGGKVYFRTAEGSKLLGVTINQQVAFEVDEIEGDVARSVIVRGPARELHTRAELEYAESLPLRPWVPSFKYHFVVIEPEEITGRLFHLGAEPE